MFDDEARGLKFLQWLLFPLVRSISDFNSEGRELTK